ncbi:MAG: GyrI-like domain-containing protein [Gammaproteobacteria bacterium]|nr:GyrI-like domain-containing protein [Gammaproteobacteria bacterium]
MQIGIPVAESVEGDGTVIAASIPAGQYLRTLHRGPYKTLGKTYERVQTYTQEQGLGLADYMLESYLNDPNKVSPDALETEVLVPFVE